MKKMPNPHAHIIPAETVIATPVAAPAGQPKRFTLVPAPPTEAEKVAQALAILDSAIATAERAREKVEKIEAVRDSYDSKLDESDDARTELERKIADAVVAFDLGEITAEALASLQAQNSDAIAVYSSALASRDAADRRLQQAEKECEAAETALTEATGVVALPVYRDLRRKAREAYDHFTKTQRLFLEVGWTGGPATPVSGDSHANHGARDDGPEGGHLDYVARTNGINPVTHGDWHERKVTRIPLDRLRAMAIALTKATKQD